MWWENLEAFRRIVFACWSMHWLMHATIPIDTSRRHAAIFDKTTPRNHVVEAGEFHLQRVRHSVLVDGARGQRPIRHASIRARSQMKMLF